ncbi:cyclophilin peptidyl-prolyl cis-trans isomerase Cyp8 [Coemansia sp. RSA 552]|nr:cyclophilin peptidyl-prolyl cis-trans isomerase Cyp8 [Coemansia sp. RSA 552]
MGRWTDKPFISQGEWSNAHDDSQGMSFGGKKTRIPGRKDNAAKLAFDCCALSLKPFTEPMCTPDGFVFDAANITEYVKENKKHPFTEEPLATGDLVELDYHKNAGGEYVDPVTFKPFSEFTKIVANQKSGKVYLSSTIDEFNAKPKSWTDLVTGEPFTREDIIVLQDPEAPKKNSVAVKSKAVDVKDKASSAQQPAAAAAAVPETKKKPAYNAAGYSKGQTAASFTSTAMAPVTQNESEVVDPEDYMFARIKAKGYVRISTSLGDINMELHCDQAPRTCYNFIKLAQSGYYNGTVFHRSVRNFMIQGGDPTGSGRGGKSWWGGEFNDEIAKRKKLSHSARGVVSMANRGPNTNRSQFFVLYREAKQLDGKHTIFGRVVGGLAVLDKMERVPTDDADRPETDISITGMAVFVDPYAEFTKRLERKLEHQKADETLALGKRQRTVAEEEQRERETTTWLGTKIPPQNGKGPAATTSSVVPASRTVGKYLKKTKLEAPAKPPTDVPSRSSKAASAYKFGDFSGW